MHLPDGILPLPLTLGGYAASILIAAYCLRRIRRMPDPYQEVPRAALLTAAFFIASLVHFPLPPVSVHLVLNGLLGVILGWFAFPAILVGLFLQAVMFGHGGLTTLGINGLVLGLPALVAFGFFRLHRLWPVAGRRRAAVVAGFIAGAGGIALAVALFGLALFSHLPAHLDPTVERMAFLALAMAYLPVMVLEGVLAAVLVAFFLRAGPELLERQ